MTYLDDGPVFSVSLMRSCWHVLAGRLHLTGQQLACDWMYSIPEPPPCEGHPPGFILPADCTPCTTTCSVVECRDGRRGGVQG